MHATQLASEGIRYLGSLELNELCQLQGELDALWSGGQRNISNNLYGNFVDGINYEISQLSSDPYSFVLKKTDSELKNIVDYFGQLYSQGKGRIDNAT